MQKQQKIFISVFIIFVCAILVYARFYYQPKPKPAPKKDSVYEKVTFPSLDAALLIFDNNYKKALVATEDDKSLGVSENMMKSSAVWENIFFQYGEEQPSGYSKTENWKDKIDVITRAVREADQQVKQKDFAKAHESLLTTGGLIKNIYKENNINNFSSDSFQLYVTSERLIKEVESTSAKKDLPDVKLAFTTLKQYQLGSDYKNEMVRLEDILGRLDRLGGPDFELAKREFGPAVKNIYLGY